LRETDMGEPPFPLDGILLVRDCALH
jgi:hypothetical protein